jgi:hypothetical protein
MKVVQVGHLFMTPYLVYSKLKQMNTLVIQEQNIIVKNVVGITVISLKMDQSLLAKDIVTTERV